MAEIKTARAQDANGNYTVPIDVDVTEIEVNAKSEAIKELLEAILRYMDSKLTDEQKEEIINNYLNGLSSAYVSNEEKFNKMKEDIAYSIYSDQITTDLQDEIDEVKQQVYAIKYEVHQTSTVYIKAKDSDEAVDIFDRYSGDIASEQEPDWEDIELISINEDKCGEEALYDRNGYVWR